MAPKSSVSSPGVGGWFIGTSDSITEPVLHPPVLDLPVRFAVGDSRSGGPPLRGGEGEMNRLGIVPCTRGGEGDWVVEEEEKSRSVDVASLNLERGCATELARDASENFECKVMA